jgi:hypothetical protein
MAEIEEEEKIGEKIAKDDEKIAGDVGGCEENNLPSNGLIVSVTHGSIVESDSDN